MCRSGKMFVDENTEELWAAYILDIVLFVHQLLNDAIDKQ